MSERGMVAVEMPISHRPSPREERDLVMSAAGEARRLVGRYGGRLLGLTSVDAVTSAQTGGPALRFLFAALAPERVWFARRSHPVGTRG